MFLILVSFVLIDDVIVMVFVMSVVFSDVLCRTKHVLINQAVESFIHIYC